MATCLNLRPHLIKGSLADACQSNSTSKYWRELFHKDKPFKYNFVILPCGKCVNCLKKRQDSYVVRIQEEAKKRGNLSFVTLTYREDTIPLAQSLWKIDKHTGEMSLEQLPTILASGAEEETYFRDQMRKIPPTHKARYIDFPLFRQIYDLDPNYEYVARITPTVCRKDARLWLKRCRVEYEREHGFKLSPFVYMMVQEYGFQSCRPHVHILFMGLNRLEVAWMCNRWNLGRTQFKCVPPFNGDGTNAYALVSRYISKYMTKGRFECDSVKDRCAERPRICQSRGIGSDILEKIKDYVFAYSIYGKYNPDTLVLDNGTPLTDSQITMLVNEIPKRLSYSPDGKYRYPLPRIFVDKLFKEKIYDPKQSRTIFRSYKIWSLVLANIRSQYDALYRRQLREFCSQRPLGALRENLVAFEVFRENASAFEDSLGEKKILEQYQKTKY